MRGGHVTGVQTCALPIAPPLGPHLGPDHRRERDRRSGTAEGRTHPANPAGSALRAPPTAGTGAGGPVRSEERRVGKEGMAGAAVGERTDTRTNRDAWQAG